jgi:hypothetical protein
VVCSDRLLANERHIGECAVAPGLHQFPVMVDKSPILESMTAQERIALMGREVSSRSV